MLYLLASHAVHDGHMPLFNLLRYITFRAGCACLTALVISLLMGKPLIAMLRRIQRGGQPIRALGPERHLLEKTGTPTMGGVLILFSLAISVLLWGDLENGFVWAVLLTTLAFGAVGFADDYLKLSRRNTDGVSKRTRLGGRVRNISGVRLVSANAHARRRGKHGRFPVCERPAAAAGLCFSPSLP
jgi:phospho-N-acetylmuramoyl-pentapeptide-transferase